MAQKTLELTFISATDLKNVNLLSKMEVYAVVSLSGDPRSQQRIQADRTGGRNPIWNATLRFTVPDSAAGSLDVLLRTERALGDRDVGEVHIPLSKLLFDAPNGPVPAKFVAYQVCEINSSKLQGVLYFSYKLGEVTQPTGYAPNEPATAYPPAAGRSTATPYAAPPPPYHGHVYPPPPQQLAGYDDYQQRAARPPMNNNIITTAVRFTSQLVGVAGLAGNSLVLADRISDAFGSKEKERISDEYHAGYDAGFHDAGFHDAKLEDDTGFDDDCGGFDGVLEF